MTRAAARLKKVGLEVRSRPYSYLDTPQLDLDSLVLYTTSLKMSVSVECWKNMPIYNTESQSVKLCTKTSQRIWSSANFDYMLSPWQAKLVNVPISPSVVGVLFFIVGFVLFLVFQFDTYHWAVWL